MALIDEIGHSSIKHLGPTWLSFWTNCYEIISIPNHALPLGPPNAPQILLASVVLIE